MNAITWRDAAFDAMDAIVRNNPDRVSQIAAALRKLADGLRTDPATFGESREGPYRVESVNPLTMYFRHAPDEQLVYVVWVHIRRRRRP